MKKSKNFMLIILAGTFLTAGVLLSLKPNQGERLNPESVRVPIDDNKIGKQKRKPSAEDRKIRKEKAMERYAQIESQSMLKSTPSEDAYANGKIKAVWQEKGSKNLAGRMLLTEYDSSDNVIYAASDGGMIWKSDVNGNNWLPLNDLSQFVDVRTIKVVPTNTGKRLIVVADDPVYNYVIYSDNEGRTWNTTSGLSDVASVKRGAVIKVESGSYEVVILAKNKSNGKVALYKSVDFGTSFTKISDLLESNLKTSDIWTTYYNENGTLYIMDRTNLLTYHMGILNYISNVPVYSSHIYNEILLTGHVSEDNKTTLYTAYTKKGGDDYAYFYKSEDSGKTWSFNGEVSGHGPFMENSFECSATNPNNLYYGCTPCFYSWDGGQTWNQFTAMSYLHHPENNLHWDIPGLNSFKGKNGEEVLYISSDGGTYISKDSLRTVSNISLSGQNVSQYYSVFTGKNNVIFAGSQDQGIQRSLVENGGVRDFAQLQTGDVGSICSSDSGKSIWVSSQGGNGIHYYPNAVNSTYYTAWKHQGYPTNLWLPSLAPDPANSNIAYMGGGYVSSTGKNLLIKLAYNSNRITASELPFDFGNSIADVAISPVNPNKMYVLTNSGNFFYSNDKGSSWTRSNTTFMLNGHYLTGSSILLSPKDTNRIYIGALGRGTNGPVMVSNNGGQSFSSMSNGLPLTTRVHELSCDQAETMIFAATEVGPYVYIVAEGQWHGIEGLSAPDQSYQGVQYVEELNAARFCTYGRGIWDFVISSVKITSPLDGYEFAEGEDITVTTEINMPDENIILVAFEANGKGFATDGSAPYEVVLPNATEDSYTIVAKAYNSDLEEFISAPVVIIKAKDSTTTSLTAINDAYLKNGAGNNGSELITQTDNTVTYLMFDLSNIEGTITDVNLNLTCSSGVGNGQINIYKGSHNNWSEHNLDNTNKPQLSSSLGYGIFNYRSGNQYTWELDSKLVSARETLSLIVVQHYGNDVAFASKENSNQNWHPELTVTYLPIKLKSDEEFAKKHIKKEYSAKLYPNPARISENVTVELSGIDQADARIYNSKGQMVHQIKSVNNEFEINTSNLSKGIYIIHIKGSKQAIVKKLIIE